METEHENPSTRSPLYGLLAIPVTIAIMLAMMVAATWDTVDYDESNWNTLLMLTTVLLAGGLLGKAPRIIFEPVGTRPSLVSLGFAAIIVTYSLYFINLGLPLFAIAFPVMAIGVHLLDRSKRHEGEIILVGIVAGFVYAIQVAAAGHEWASEGQYVELIDIDRAVTGYLFFTWWMISILTGAVLALAMRGRLQDPGQGSWFADLPDVLGREHSPLFAGLSFWIGAHVFSLWHLSTLDNPDSIFLSEHIGFFWAFFTGLVAMFVAYCWAEHWRTLGSLIGLNWLLYTIGGWQDTGLFGLDDVGFLNGSLGGLSWFAIFFWLNATVLWAGFTGRLIKGGERRGAGQAHLWWGKHWYGITIASALVTALAVRTLWNVIPAMNAAGTGEWDMTGGSDPWYMKRVIDYILAQNSHFVIDMDRSYPVGSINPRPPLFSWTLALGGTLLNPFLGGNVNDAAWWSIAGLPALYGALTVLPIAATCRRFFGLGAGAIGAWLIALMPGHVSHSTFALADHDSFVILFMSLGFHFWLRAVESAGSDRLLDYSDWKPMHLIEGIRATFRERAPAMAYAILAGVSFATVALGWKGFVYGLAIIYAAFFVQTALNLLRRRDSMPLTSIAVVMMTVTFLLPLPFYGNMELNLLFDASGFQPMFYILGFTLINGWVVTSFRDKPWLMVVIMGSGLFSIVLGTLFILQFMEIYNGWDVLFTGGYYFSKNKVFGTIAEAQAPSRGQLFANFGPLVFIFALGMGILALWRGMRHRKQPEIVMSVWILVAAYMAWSAGRFMFNATPVMAIMGSAAIVGLWRWCGTKDYLKTWRRLGVSSSGSRLRSTISASRKHPGVPAIVLVLLLLSSQHAIYGIDSGIPRGEVGEKQIDDTIHGFMPDVLRAELFGWSVLDPSPYTGFGVDDDELHVCQGQCWYMGTFGPGFNGRSWNQAYDWLEHQDQDVSFSERPAFVSWWDYGFQALAQGQHPTVADNFQSGIPAAGNMLLASGEEDTLALFIATLAEGDMRYEVNSDPDDDDGQRFTPGFTNVMNRHMSDTTWDEWVSITQMSSGADVAEHSFKVIGTADDVILTEGHAMNADGTLSPDHLYRLYEDRVLIGEYATLDEAIGEFDDNSKVDWDAGGFSNKATHYIIGDYWYTDDLVEDFGDVSTSLHRQNARYAIARDLLITVFTMAELVDVYHDLTQLTYNVASYEGGPGETVMRNNDIRYFAVDSRLYPIGGYRFAEQSLHNGNPTGIFYAPTTLSGLDPEYYIQSTYITQRGDRPQQMMTAAEFEAEYIQDVKASQSGTGGDIIQMVDLRVDHQPAFFETMIARAYIGYGGTQLGLDTSTRIAQPSQHFSGYGTPESPLTYARPLPGAMLNHFVVANWYEPGADSQAIGQANTGVKILKYYSGATLEGDVVLGEVGTVPNAKLLIERDAFSGEDNSDLDDRTYWIPIATAQADDEGHFSVRVPSGRIRVTAFMGDSHLDAARDSLKTGGTNGAQEWLIDMLTDENEDREINPITGILANVSGSTWLGETSIQVNGSAGHSNGEATLEMTISITASGASGTLNWQGEGDFGDEPLVNVDLRISNIWDETRQDAYIITTSSGEVEGERQFGPGATGQVTFTGQGIMSAIGIATATDFTGNHTRPILDAHSFTGDGIINGKGTFVGTIGDGQQTSPECNNGTMANESSYCLLDANVTDTFMIDGRVENVSGRFTAEGLDASFTTTLYRETIISAGFFDVDTSDESLETYGTINGTGVFGGTGHFSGDMVKPGSFHLVDAIPGTYHVAVLFENGTEVILPMPLIVPLEPDGGIELLLPGTWIHGDAKSMDGDPVSGRLEIVDIEEQDAEVTEPCGEIAWVPCYFMADENGSFSIGPVLEGKYFVTMDADEDGFDEYRSPMIEVTTDTPGDVTPENIERIPPMFDVDFLVIEGDGNDITPIEGQNITFSNLFTPIEILARDNGNGSYNVELPMGEWVAESILDENHILYEEIVLVDEDLEGLIMRYVASEWVNGSVMFEPAKEDDPLMPHKNQMVNVQWGGITEDTMTDDDGNFSFQLPVGAEVNLTVHVVVGNTMVGQHFTVGEDLLETPLMPQFSVGASGDFFLYREGNAYTTSVPGWDEHPYMLEAFDQQTNVTWQWMVEPLSGRFTTHLLPGTDNVTRNWTFSINDPALNVPPLEHTAMGDNASLMLIANPALVEATFRFFIDHDVDGNASNGTAQAIDFRVHPSTDYDSAFTINVSKDDGDWDLENGSIVLELEVGEWIFEAEAKDARDEANATPFNTLLSTETGQIDVALDSGTMDVDLGFLPEWRTSVTLENIFNAPLENWTVLLDEVDGDRTITLQTDANGTIVQYIDEGEWVVIVGAFIQDDGDDENDDPMQEFRGLITTDAEQTGIVWTTDESAQFNLTLIEEGSGDVLSGFIITAVSEDGLGEVLLGPSDEDGVLNGGLMPGTWTFSMNRTDNNLRWILDNHSMTFNWSAPWSADTNLTLSKWVEIAGNLYWDLNDDDAWTFGEGIVDVNVTVNGTAYGPLDLTTDSIGTWRAFVPVNDTYDVFATKDGFSNGSTTIEVAYAVNTSDIELFAGSVTVGGVVTHVLPSEWDLISDEVNLLLIPESGLSRDSVQPSKVLDDGSWNGTWSAVVEPGNWILHVTYDGEEGRFAAMALLDAAVLDGGDVDIMLSTASVLNIATTWADFEGESHTLADTELLTGPANLVISKGLTMRWNATVDSTGSLSLLLPAGDFSISGHFATDQRDMEMTYSGAREATVVGGGVESPDQMITFRVDEDHSVSYSVGANHTNLNQSEDDGDYFTMIAEDGDGGEYLVGELNMTLDYDGNRALDDYILTAVLNGGDAAFWTVEMWDELDANWSISTTYKLGLDNNMSDEIRLRITAANLSTAQSYTAGHSLVLRLTNSDESYSEYALNLFIPQMYNFTLVGEIDDVVGITPGNDETYAFTIQNTGNGDDELRFEISDVPDLPELFGWGVEGASMIPIGAGATQTYSVNIHVPSDSPEAETSVWITVTSKDGTSYAPFEIKIKTALPELEIIDRGVIGQSQDGFAAANTVNTFYVWVENSGDVDAPAVRVEIFNEDGDFINAATAEVAKGETQEFLISVDTSPYGLGGHTFTAHINMTGQPVAEQPDDALFKVNIQKEAAEEASSWLGLVVLVLFLGVLMLFWKFSGRRRSGQPF
jgi:asparagine N-glycosylation enzyme membrane subunit Stt3/uncharacterized membrane protein